MSVLPISSFNPPLSWNENVILEQGMSFLKEKGKQFDVMRTAWKNLQKSSSSDDKLSLQKMFQAKNDYKAFVASSKKEIRELNASIKSLGKSEKSEQLAKISTACSLALDHCAKALKPSPIENMRFAANLLALYGSAWGFSLSYGAQRGANYFSCPREPSFEDTILKISLLAMIPSLVYWYRIETAANRLEKSIEETRRLFEEAVPTKTAD